MQCAACLEVFPEALDACPRCEESPTDTTPAAPPAPERPDAPRTREADASAMTENANVTTQTTTPPSANGSTLIEFPGVNRNRPAWRKELSERFREIQQRRALEAEAEQRRQSELAAHGAADEFATAPRESEATKQLGLVPAPDEPELNPLVVKALRRIERARRESQPVARPGSSRGHAAAAAARVVEEQPAEEAEALTARAPAKPAAEKAVRAERREQTERADAGEAGRAASLLVVQTKPAAEAKAAPAAESVAAEAAPVERPKSEPQAAPAAKAAPAEKPSAAASVEAEAEARPQPRKISGVIDDHWLERREAEILPKVAAEAAAYDDRAPRPKRLAAAAVDLLVVAFLCAPFAAVIELTIGDWSEPRVLASLGGIAAVVLFLYHTCSVALASRTLGMKLFRLHAVDADTARVPTTWQCARRALVYVLSLATFGLGILYALIDAEGRTAHDLLSGTVIVKE